MEERQATLLTVVERERAAKLRAIEQAAGVAAAAETLAESAPGADPQALSKTAKDAAADTYEDAMFSPSTRDADAGVALDAMDAKAKAQLDKADAALARLTREKFEAERRMADERAAWGNGPRGGARARGGAGGAARQAEDAGKGAGVATDGDRGDDRRRGRRILQGCGGGKGGAEGGHRGG